MNSNKLRFLIRKWLTWSITGIKKIKKEVKPASYVSPKRKWRNLDLNGAPEVQEQMEEG